MEQTAIHQIIVSLLSKYSRPDDSLVRAFYPVAKLRLYEPKDLFISKGEIPNRVAYVRTGAVAAYKSIGRQRQLVRVWKEDDLIMHAASLFKPQKSEVDILFCYETEVLEIRVKDLYWLLQEHPGLTPYFGHYVSAELNFLRDHICLLKKNKLKGRIEHFRQHYKLHYQLLPDEHIASFLGMSLRWYQKNK